MPSFKTQRVKINIQKDMASVLQKDCYLHEKEIYEEIHDIECPILKYGEVTELDITDEFARLENEFGADPENNNTYVETVYGRRGRDLHRIAEAIHEPTEVETVIDDEPDEVEKLPTEMDRKELKRALDNREVDYNRNLSNIKLRDLLVSVQMEDEQAA